jgi:hypothetical protein
MDVVRRRLDQAVGVGRVVLPVHPLVVGAGDHVPEVADHAVREERLAVVVPVEAPGVRRAFADDLEHLLRDVVAPDAAVEEDSLRVGGAGLADLRLALDALVAVEPAVRPPLEAVDDAVADLAVVPAVEHGDGVAVRNVVAVRVGDEDHAGRRAAPDAAVSGEDAGEILGAVPEDLSLVENAVAVGVLEDEDPVADRRLPRTAGALVRVAFGDPQAAALVEGGGDRLRHVGLAGEEGDLEPVGHGDALRGLGGGERDVLRVLGVLRALRIPEGLGVLGEAGEERQQEREFSSGHHSG